MKTKTLTLTHLNLSDLSERNLAIEEIVKFAGDYLAGLPSPKHTARFDLENNRKIGALLIFVLRIACGRLNLTRFD